MNLSMELDEDSKKLWSIFHPRSEERVKEVNDKKTRFVHYTRGATAVSILQNKRLWMRNTTCMNDYSEVRHGLESLLQALESTSGGNAFKIALHGIFPGFIEPFLKYFNAPAFFAAHDTYILCLSEHDDGEDETGRLSMWRAYAADAGVAIVIKNDAFKLSPDLFGVFTTHVEYGGMLVCGAELERIAQKITENSAFILALGQVKISEWVTRMFVYAAIALKHPAFKEEREWRAVHLPWYNPSNVLETEIVTISGVPQRIYKIPIDRVPQTRIPNLIDRIIIGPTQYPVAVRDAFVRLLKSDGVLNPDSKVICSYIPLRT